MHRVNALSFTRWLPGHLELMCCTCRAPNVVVESMQQASREPDVTWRALLDLVAIAADQHRSTSLLSSCAHPGDSSIQPANSVHLPSPVHSMKV